MKLEVLNTSGKATGKTVELPADIFGVEPNDHAIYLDVKQHLANKRQGTHQAKERGVIVGSTRKIKKQKGTGTARAGSIKNPLFRGGGRIFGPRPRNYGFKLNKKVKSLACRSALSTRANDGEIVVIEDFNMETPKTKDFVAIMNGLGLSNEKTVVVLGSQDDNLFLSSKNLKKSSVIPASNLNTYTILNCRKLVICESALETLVERYSN